ncbi:MAG: acyl carrier protein [Methylococcaceae bacterium]
MKVSNQVIDILIETLQLDGISGQLGVCSHLLGAIPEFDSMSVVAVLTALEDAYGFYIDDDEIDASIFETVGSLVEFVENKLND